jgi:hypothetical protein
MKNVAASNENVLEITLKAVVIYDDLDLAARATTLLERVALHAEDAMKWDVKSWRFNILKQPTLAGITISVAADADLIVFALHESDFAPEELLDWLTNWANHRQIPDAAVMLLRPDENAAPTPVCNELKWFAGSRGLNFLGSREMWNDGNSRYFVHPSHIHPSPKLKRCVMPSAEPFAGDENPPQHWGINE